MVFFVLGRAQVTTRSQVCLACMYTVPESAPIPDHVRRFILTSVPTVPFLEAALLFFRAPATGRTLLDAARLLYIPPRRTQELLQALCDAGVLTVAGEVYRYAGDADLTAMLSDVEQAYAQHLVEITRLIHDTNHQHAIRFADAFRWRKE